MVTGIGSIASLTDYAEMARQLLEADHCGLIVIDIQQKLLPPIFQKEQLIRNSQLLIRLAGIVNIPTIMTTQYAKGLGGAVTEITSLLPDAKPIDKQMFSCYVHGHVEKDRLNIVVEILCQLDPVVPFVRREVGSI